MNQGIALKYWDQGELFESFLFGLSAISQISLMDPFNLGRIKIIRTVADRKKIRTSIWV